MTSANALGYGSPIMVKDYHPHDDGKHHSSHMAMMMIIAIIFIIFIIFAIIIFAAMFRRREHDGVGMEAITPIIAATAARGLGDGGYGHGAKNYEWDNHRDMSKYFYDQRAENDKYFYEQQKTTLLGFKDNEIQGLKNTAEINANISKMREEFKEDKLREQGNRINHLETVMAIRGLGLVPSFNPQFNAPHGAYGYTS